MDKQYKQDFLQAGKLAGQVRAYGKSLIKPGASYNDVIAKIRLKIQEVGAIPAFPPQIALNDVAAHFLPMPDEDIIFSDQLIKLDIGVCFKGAIGDCAVTVDLSGKHQNIVDAAEKALLNAERIIKVGMPVRFIGKIIEEAITSFGLTPIKNLAGHGLGYYKVHTAPNIPNYEDRSTALIKPGMTFAIEPFATNGKGLIYDAGGPAIFSFLKEGVVRSKHARQLLVKIKTFKGLPFALHDLLEEGLSLAEVKAAVRELLLTDTIAGYPPLIDEAHGFVAQAENSVLVDEDGRVSITTRL